MFKREVDKRFVDYVESAIIELTRIHDVPKPPLKVSLFGSLYLPLRIFGTRRIIISSRYLDYWEVDEDTTKICLKYTIAHEFCHYLQDLRGRMPVLRIPPTRPPLGYHFLEYLNLLTYDLENEARIFAEDFSGLKTRDYEELLRGLRRKRRSSQN
ncbi:MAG: hypothetical protein QW638_00550 [Candidatus Bathyarchaeia archaeon]|nr:hypothetical protein [Candidatus Bathyarchaeota archaeon]